jgi:very-short-patch-repair endonuclease
VVGKGAPVDLAIAETARAQHGVVTTRQLVKAGLTRAAISKRVAAGRLFRLHQGVYAVGHDALNWESRWMAAVLAYGDGAVLSHASAAALWGLLRPVDGPIDVSVMTHGGRKRRQGIRVHRCPSLAGAPLPTRGLQRRQTSQVTKRHGIPVTTPARTVCDLRRTLPPQLVRRAIRQAEFMGLSLAGIETDRTRSDLEGDFLRLCRHHRLPPPEVNVPFGRWTVDFLWREKRLAVETDSYLTHRGSVAFEDDRARDLDLRRAGFAIHRFSERQLEAEPAAVAADVAAALRRARS